MRIITRALAGLGTAAVIAGGIAATAAPAAAAAAPATGKTTVSWGAYFSADGKAKASGVYKVSFEKIKVGYWKTWFTWDEKCWERNGKDFCKKVKTPHKEWAWKWVPVKNYTVHSTLVNLQWHPSKWQHKRCAWETFKVRHNDGKVTFHRFSTCHKGAERFTFHAKNVDRIWVNVARGNEYKPLSAFSGWRPVL